METLLNCAINYDFQPAGIDIFQFLSSLLYKPKAGSKCLPKQLMLE